MDGAIVGRHLQLADTRYLYITVRAKIALHAGLHVGLHYALTP